jgi:hypothetical protein
MTSFVIAANAAWKLSVLVTTAVVSPQNAHAPTGSGPSTKPVIVDRKMLNNAHACGTTASGRGTTKFTIIPTAMDIANGLSDAPFHTNPSDGALEAPAALDLARASSPLASASPPSPASLVVAVREHKPSALHHRPPRAGRRRRRRRRRRPAFAILLGSTRRRPFSLFHA